MTGRAGRVDLEVDSLSDASDKTYIDLASVREGRRGGYHRQAPDTPGVSTTTTIDIIIHTVVMSSNVNTAGALEIFLNTRCIVYTKSVSILL